MQTSTLQQHPKKEQADKAKIVYSEHQKKKTSSNSIRTSMHSNQHRARKAMRTFNPVQIKVFQCLYLVTNSYIS